MSGPATGRAISSTEDGPRYEPECIPDHLDFPDEEIALPVAGPDIHRVTKVRQPCQCQVFHACGSHRTVVNGVSISLSVV